MAQFHHEEEEEEEEVSDEEEEVSDEKLSAQQVVFRSVNRGFDCSIVLFEPHSASWGSVWSNQS